MAFFEYLCHLFVCMFFSVIFFLSVLKLVDTFFLIGKFNSLLLKIEQHKAIIKMLKPHITPEVVHPNIKKTLLRGEEEFSIGLFESMVMIHLQQKIINDVQHRVLQELFYW